MANKAMEHQQAMEKLVKLIGREQECAAVISPKDSTWIDILEEQKKKSDGKFMVLIVGIFSTGKSSMINALIGESLLPSGLLPETGVLTELHYGEQKRITVYPKPGKYISDEPFTLPEASMAQIKKYVSLNRKDEKTGEKSAEAPFERMVVEWPLEILKEGIVLVDTVGLNDPYGNGAITERYLPEADAILYLLSCHNPPCTELDKGELETLQSYGFKKIMFTYTHYDIALENYKYDEEGMEAMKAANADFCLANTELGEESIHYVNSLEGLAAATEENPVKRNDRRVRSGYSDLERFLETYLVENKGREQVDVLTRMMKTKRDEMASSIAVQDAAAQGEREAVLKRADAAKKELESIVKRSQAAGKTFRTMMKGGDAEIEKLVVEQMSTVADSVSIAGYEPQTQLPTGFARLNPIAQRTKADALLKECRNAFDEEVKKANNRWSQSVLKDAMDAKIKKSVENVEQDIKSIAVDLQGVEDTLVGVADKTNPKTAMQVAGNVALGVVYALLTQDYLGATQIGVYGIKKAAIASLVGGSIFVGAVMLGAPIAIPVAVAAALVGQIIAQLTGSNKRAVANTRNSVEQEMRRLYADPENQQKNVDAVMENVRASIDDICDAMDSALAEDIAKYEKLIQETVSAANGSVEEKAKGMAERSKALTSLDEVMESVNAIRAEYGLEKI